MAQVTRDPDTGAVSYRGFPVEAAGGEPQVLTPVGWMGVSAFEASSLTEEDLKTAQLLAAQGGRMTRIAREGPGWDAAGRPQ